MQTADFPTGDVLSCIAFPRDEGPRNMYKFVPLVSFMTQAFPFVLLAYPAGLLGWTVLCSWELERQHSDLLHTITWPNWDADEEVLEVWYNEQNTKFGNLTVSTLPEGIHPERLDTPIDMQFATTIERLLLRVSLGEM